MSSPVTYVHEDTVFGRSRYRLDLKRAHEIPPDDPLTSWLIQDIWPDQGVGILGGPPKGMKSLLTNDMSVSVASGTPFLGTFEVKSPGPVIMVSMEGTPGLLRHRLDGIAEARGLSMKDLPIYISTAPSLFIDNSAGFMALEDEVRATKPRLLVLDPFVRIFKGNEDDAGSVSKVLGRLRKLQREYGTGIIVVHHTRKGATTTTGQTLRGSGDLHAWGDTNLYLTREDEGVSRVTIEHRASVSPEGFRFAVVERHLELLGAEPDPAPELTLQERILPLLASGPLGLSDLQEELHVKRETIGKTLREMAQEGLIKEEKRKWVIQRSVSALPLESGRDGTLKRLGERAFFAEVWARERSVPVYLLTRIEAVSNPLPRRTS